MCHERTGLHVRVTRRQGYMYVSRGDRVTCACHEGIGWGVTHHAVFAYNTGSSERGNTWCPFRWPEVIEADHDRIQPDRRSAFRPVSRRR